MAVATLTSTRALRRPRRADPRAIVGIVITLVALAGSVAFWVSTTDSRPVLVATRDLPAGATLSNADLGIAYVRVDDAVYRAAVPADSLQSLVGRELGEPIHAQQVLARAQIANQLALGRDQVAITIPARPDSAVDGRLRPGDSVQILVTVSDKSRDTAHTSQVLERAQVYEVGRDAPLAGSSATTSDTSAPRGAITSVTLAVTADEARQLAEARRTGDLDIVLLPPPEPSHE
jgi:Flp pilus assembly protein CpaB